MIRLSFVLWDSLSFAAPLTSKGSSVKHSVSPQSLSSEIWGTQQEAERLRHMSLHRAPGHMVGTN